MAARRRLLEDLAHQIGVAAHAARLTEEAVRLSADLQRSRERLVNTREEERRRLRRDLHDGLGPQLASLTMKAEAARDLIAVDTVRAETLLSSLIDQTQSAVADVRRLVYALRPPALDALGSRRGDPVASFPPRPRRHAREGRGSREAASSARRRRGRRLPDLPRSREQRRPAFRGEGLRRAPRPGNRGWSAAPANPGRRAGIGEDRSSGIGLASMRERAGELGGWCTVQAVPSGGTIVKASLPALDVKEEAAKPDLRGA